MTESKKPDTPHMQSGGRSPLPAFIIINAH
jgi:hypothetical protein